MKNNQDALSVSELAVRRSENLLFKGMSWGLTPGTFLAVTGPSGIGKSSLLSCLAGNLKPAEGGFSFLTDDTTQVGRIFQDLRLTANSTVLTNVLCGGLGRLPWYRTLFGFDGESKKAAFEILRRLEIDPLVHKPVKKISGGEQQRTAIARLLHHDPEIILADEPTSNLDPVLANKVLGRIRSLCKERSRVAICVLHDGDQVEKFADMELRLSDEFENGWEIREVKR